jgi:hypothetical protein
MMRHIALPLVVLLLFPGASFAQESATPGRAAATPSAAAQGGQAGGQKVVEEGLFPASFKVPGTDVSLAIGGYVKVDFIQDFKAMGIPSPARVRRNRSAPWRSDVDDLHGHFRTTLDDRLRGPRRRSVRSPGNDPVYPADRAELDVGRRR